MNLDRATNDDLKLREQLRGHYRKLEDDYALEAIIEYREKILSARVAGYLVALFAPVASDALELVYAIWQIVTQGSGTYWVAREDEAAALIERFAAERERKAREEEREACAERAVAWQKALCKADGWTCKTCTECDQLRAAIKEAENA